MLSIHARHEQVSTCCTNARHEQVSTCCTNARHEQVISCLAYTLVMKMYL